MSNQITSKKSNQITINNITINNTINNTIKLSTFIQDTKNIYPQDLKGVDKFQDLKDQKAPHRQIIINSTTKEKVHSPQKN